MSTTEGVDDPHGRTRAEPDADTVSVCVLSIGSPQYAHAIRALEAQRPPVRHWTIANVSPVGEAFNAMLDRVTSPYVIQLDEDIELLPDAVGRMLARFAEERSRDGSVGQVAFRVHDEVLGDIVAGCKLLDVAKARRARMGASLYPDRAYNERLREAGVSTVTDRGPIVGHHARHRSDYELFLKHVVTGSKAFSREAGSPTRTDADRFAGLFRRALEAAPDEAFTMLGGLYWGIFTGVSTDADAYPAETFERLRERSIEFASTVVAEEVRRVTAECDRIIERAAGAAEDPGFHVKERYYGRRFASQLRCVRGHAVRRWDLYGIDHGEMALALRRMGRLGGVFRGAGASAPTLHEVTARIVAEVAAPELLARAPATSDAEGLVIPHGCDLPLGELVALIEDRYRAVVCDPVRLGKRAIEPDAFRRALVASGRWRVREREEGILLAERDGPERGP